MVDITSLTSGISGLAIYAYYGFYFLIFAFLFGFINYFIILKKVIFPIGANIYVQREGGDMLETGRVRKKEKDGRVEWKFFGWKRRKHTCEPYEWALMSDKKGKPFVHLKQFNDNTYLPIMPPVGARDNFEILTADVINWGIDESDRINQQYSKFGWKEAVMIGAPIVLIAITVFAVLHMTDKQVEITSIAAGAINKANCQGTPAPQQQYINQEIKPATNDGTPPV